jgi:hypothetical protein
MGWALDPKTPQTICSKINDALPEHQECLNTVESGSFDTLAVGECNTYKNETEAIACLKLVKNMFFSQGAILVCDKILHALEVNKCLTTIAEKTFTNDEIAKCSALGDRSEISDCFKKSGKSLSSFNIKYKVVKSSLKRSSSFASILMTPEKGDSLTNELNERDPGCADFLKAIYKSGKTLASSILLGDSRPIRAIPMYGDNRSGVFFHYTDSDALISLLHPEMDNRNLAQRTCSNDHAFEQINDFLRTRKVESSYLWKKVLYVAADEESSRPAGKHRIEFDMDPDARVLQADTHAWPLAIKELDSRYPGLIQACGLHTERPPVSYSEFGSDLYAFIADDSGIDLVDYDAGAFGLSTYVENRPVYRHQWFQILDFKSVRQTKLQ